MTREEYLKDPCAVLSIPYWKAKAITAPGNMRIVHDRDFSPDAFKDYDYTDERYFRLRHDLQRIGQTRLPDFRIETAGPAQLDTIVSVINRSYTDLAVSASQLEGYMHTPVYVPELWLLVRERATGICTACGIADFDQETAELTLEWIQVLPGYRGRKIGQTLVNALLDRGRAGAAFATVSGKMDDPTHPEALYRKCGFVGQDVWHVLRKK